MNGPHAVVWYVNDGGALPSYSTIVLVNQLEQSTFVQAADVDQDGDFDAIGISFVDDESLVRTLRWFEFDAASAPLNTIHEIQTPFEGFELTVVDLDGDDDADILTREVGRLAVYENTVGIEGGAPVSGGFFAREIPHEVFPDQRAHSMEPADIDGDGDLDIATSFLDFSSFDHLVSWFQQNGEALPDRPDLSVYCLMADISGDEVVNAGDLSLVIANWNTEFADLNGDGNTDAHDLAFLLANWGPCFD